MNNTITYNALLLIFTICLLGCHVESTSKRKTPSIKSVHIVAGTADQFQVVKPMSDKKGAPGRRLDAPRIPINLKSSNIVITDTIASRSASQPDIVITDTIAFSSFSSGAIDVSGSGWTPVTFLDLGLDDNEYYCQEFNKGKTDIQQGVVGTHLNVKKLSNLTPSYPAKDFWLFAPSGEEICVISKTATDYNDRQCFSTKGKRLCVYVKNGHYHIGELK